MPARGECVFCIGDQMPKREILKLIEDAQIDVTLRNGAGDQIGLMEIKLYLSPEQCLINTDDVVEIIRQHVCDLGEGLEEFYRAH